MKKLIGFSLLLTITTTVFAQKEFNSRSKLGVVFGYGQNEAFKVKPLSGGASFNGKGYFIVGINYIKPLKKWFSLETGIEYTHHNLRGNSAPTPEVFYWDTEASLLAVPVNARFNFLKHFYAQSGLLFNIDISDKSGIDSQTGIGGTLGFGGQYDFKGGLSLFLNPYLRNYGIFAFDTPRKIFSNDMVTEYGVKLGVLYSIGK